jgi:hypothetical protein
VSDDVHGGSKHRIVPARCRQAAVLPGCGQQHVRAAPGLAPGFSPRFCVPTFPPCRTLPNSMMSVPNPMNGELTSLRLTVVAVATTPTWARVTDGACTPVRYAFWAREFIWPTPVRIDRLCRYICVVFCTVPATSQPRGCATQPTKQSPMHTHGTQLLQGKKESALECALGAV